MTKIVHRIDDADREQILLGIVRKQPLKRIAERMNRHLSSITNEIKKHRVFIRGSYYAGNDCRYAEGCDKRNVCGDENCKMYCYTCPKKCHEFCNEYMNVVGYRNYHDTFRSSKNTISSTLKLRWLWFSPG